MKWNENEESNGAHNKCRMQSNKANIQFFAAFQMEFIDLLLL